MYIDKGEFKSLKCSVWVAVFSDNLRLNLNGLLTKKAGLLDDFPLHSIFSVTEGNIHDFSRE